VRSPSMSRIGPPSGHRRQERGEDRHGDDRVRELEEDERARVDL
jgi:hypothetical protein